LNKSCKFRQKEYNINENKIKAHLLKCSNCPQQIKQKFYSNTTSNVTEDQIQTFDEYDAHLVVNSPKPSTINTFFDQMNKSENVNK